MFFYKPAREKIMQSELKAKSVHEMGDPGDLESVKNRMTDSELNWLDARIQTQHRTGISILSGDACKSRTYRGNSGQQDVDEFWHAHILHTAKYMDD
jgi:hypothetical protein